MLRGRVGSVPYRAMIDLRRSSGGVGGGRGLGVRVKVKYVR